MKTRILNLVLIVLLLGLSSCSDDDKDIGGPIPEDFTLTFNEETNQDQMGDFSHHKMAIFNGQVWSVGGYNSYHKGLHSDVWRSSNGRAWVSHASDQFPNRKNHSLTVFDNKLWVIGGVTETTPDSFSALSDVWYSTDGSSWTLATDEPLGAASIGPHSTVVFNNKLYLIKDGGNELAESGSGNAPGCSVWSSPDGATWTRETDNAFSYRENFSAKVFNNEIYVIGGFYESTYLNEIWKSSDGISWTQVNTTGAVFSPRSNSEAVVYENKLWVFPGKNGTASINGMGLYYSNNGSQWFRYEPLPSEAGIHDFAALNYNDAMWVFGGMHQEEGATLIERIGTISSIKQD